MHIKVRDIKTGAIFRFGATNRWPVDQIASAIVERVGFTRGQAEAIARHWHKTDLYQIARGERAPHPHMPRWLRVDAPAT